MPEEKHESMSKMPSFIFSSRVNWRRKFGIFLLTAITMFVAAAFVGGQSQRPANKDILFSEPGTNKLFLDIYSPRFAHPLAGYPLVISIHGGAWELGDRHSDAALRKLTERGYALASIDYRLASQAKYPAQIDDVREAVSWLVKHAGEYHLDTNRIFAIGASAGGHLSLLLGLSQKPGDHMIKAVCAFYPPTDLVSIVPPARRGEADNPVADLLGGPISERLALAREASPITYVRKDSVPVLIFHGDADTLVPVAQSQSLETALKAAGANCTLIVNPGYPHGFGPGEATLDRIARFFRDSVKN
jgi:acetyl esterase/lipase